MLMLNKISCYVGVSSKIVEDNSEQHKTLSYVSSKVFDQFIDIFYALKNVKLKKNGQNI